MLDAARQSSAVHEPADSYFINAYSDEGHHRGWARIFVKHGQRPRRDGDGGPTWWCYVSVISDFGNFGHLWSHCGCDPVKFLSDLSMDYAMGKLLHSASDDVHEYDGEATFRHILGKVMEARRKRYIHADAAREIYSALDDEQHAITSGKNEMVNACLRIARDFGSELESAMLGSDFDEPWYFEQERINPQARDFWAFIWPLFIRALRHHHTTSEAAKRAKTDLPSPVVLGPKDPT